MIPDAGYLFSIAGLSVTLSGFSGLVAAFRRGGSWRAIDSFRLRQIPEMGLVMAFLALLTIPLAKTIGNDRTTLRLISGLALVYVLGHAVIPFVRVRRSKVTLPAFDPVVAAAVNLGVIGSAAVAIIAGDLSAYLWVLLFMLARPMLAFVLVLEDLSAERDEHGSGP